MIIQFRLYPLLPSKLITNVTHFIININLLIFYFFLELMDQN